MYDGDRFGASRPVRHGSADRAAARLLSMLSIEGIINMFVALAIILALLNYVIIPQFRLLFSGGNAATLQSADEAGLASRGE